MLKYVWSHFDNIGVSDSCHAAFSMDCVAVMV